MIVKCKKVAAFHYWKIKIFYQESYSISVLVPIPIPDQTRCSVIYPQLSPHVGSVPFATIPSWFSVAILCIPIKRKQEKYELQEKSQL